jgi:hypothetical protein
VEEPSAWIEIHVTEDGTGVLLWVVGGERYNIYIFFVRARDPSKGHVMKGQKIVEVTVKQNLSHMELPVCSNVPFQLQ